MTGQHAPLAPSSAPQWYYCSGSVRAQAAFPDIETEDARVGSATHWVIEECLRQWRDQPRAALCSDWIGQTAPNGVVIDDEMAQCAKVHVDDVLAVCQKYGTLRALMIEHRVTMPQIHPENWGTLDTALWLPAEGKLIIWDYKNGRLEVGAEGNPQLIDYAAGLVHELGINGAQDQHTDVELRVVQPRCYRNSGPVDVWSATLSDLRPHFNQLQAKAREAMENPKQSAGEHCRYCAAKLNCPTNRRALNAGHDMLNRAMGLELLPDEALGVEYAQLQKQQRMLKDRLDAADAELRQRINDGKTGTGMTLQAKQGRLKFNVPDEQVIATCAQFGIDAKANAVRTPTQIINDAPANLKDAVRQTINVIAKRPSSLELVRCEDSITAKVFKRK